MPILTPVNIFGIIQIPTENKVIMVSSCFINAPRHHVKMFGYTLSGGNIDDVDCIWYEKGNEVTFDSAYIMTGSTISLTVVAIILMIASFITIMLPLFGFIISVFFLIWAVNIWFKLFFV